MKPAPPVIRTRLAMNTSKSRERTALRAGMRRGHGTPLGRDGAGSAPSPCGVPRRNQDGPGNSSPRRGHDMTLVVAISFLGCLIHLSADKTPEMSTRYV